MDEALYVDDQCTYCWGDPRFDDRLVSGKLGLFAESIVLEGKQDSLAWPRASVKSIEYRPTYPVDLDEIARTQGVEAAQDILIGLEEDFVPEPALCFLVTDPEGVETDGFDVRVIFRNEYYAKVFAKRASAALGVPFKADTGV